MQNKYVYLNSYSNRFVGNRLWAIHTN